MTVQVTKKSLEEALNTYANLVEMYPDNEAYLQRYAKMLQTMGREATATITLQHLYDLIAKRSAKEAAEFAKQHPHIGRVSFDDMMFDYQDKHEISGKIIFELLGGMWLRLHRKTLHEGQAVCRSNDLSDSLILVLEGKVEAYTVDRNNNRILTEVIGSYDILGEHTFFKPSEMHVDAFVSSPKANIISIPREKILTMIKDNAYLEKILSQRALFRTNIQALTKSTVFQVLPLKLNKHLARRLILRRYEAGSLIYALDTPVQGIDIILKGEPCYLAQNGQGEKIILPPLAESSIAGDFALNGQGATSMAELMAKSKTTVAHIPYDDVLNVSVAFPPLKERLRKYADNEKVLMMQGLTRENKLI